MHVDLSNSFASNKYDVHNNTRIDYTINHVFSSMTVLDLNTLHLICELECRVQSLTFLAQCHCKTLSSQDPFNCNRNNVLFVTNVAFTVIVNCKPLFMITPSQNETTIRPNTITDAGISSKLELLDQFWNINSFSIYSETTLHLLGKDLIHPIISTNPPNYDANAPE